MILNAIRGQLAKADQPATVAAPRQQQQQQGGATQQQQQQQQRLPSLPQVVASASVAAAAAAAAAATATAATATAGEGYAAVGPVTEQDLQKLWQQLLQLLFPAACGSSGNSCSSTSAAAAAAAPRLYPFQCQTVLDLNDVMKGVITGVDDVTDGSEDGGSSWDESEGWQEVTHQNDTAGAADEDDAAAAAAAGELLAAAVDPMYQQSAQRCLAAARSALAHYLKVWVDWVGVQNLSHLHTGFQHMLHLLKALQNLFSYSAAAWFAVVVHCLQAVLQRYSRNVHNAATAQALALYADAASGPIQQPCGHVAFASLLVYVYYDRT
jgi:hypothetical protein